MKKVCTAVTLTIVLAVSSVFAHQWCWCCTPQNTYGWQLMTPDERKDHQAKLANVTEYNACKEYIDEHHKKMAERARGKGIVEPEMQINPCDSMKVSGLLK